VQRNELLQKYLEMANHNLLCYSRNYAMTEFKDGYKKEWNEANEEIELLESMIKDFDKSNENSDMMFQAGDYFEVSGKGIYKVIAANKEYFICCPVWKSSLDEIGTVLCLEKPLLISNKGNLEELYWIKKIDTIICVEEIKPPEINRIF
jgi:hypothetical protein